MTPTRRRRAAFTSMLAQAAAAAWSSPSEAQVAPVHFHITAGPLDDALLAFAAQSRRQILFDRAATAGLRAEALDAALAPDAALQRLLAGTGLSATSPRPGVLVLKRAAAQAVVAGDNPATASATPLEAAAPATAEIVVTGSLIRGVGETASPLLRIDREAIDRAGQASVADALNALPQNFGGVSTPQTALVGSDTTGQNFSAANGVNLRGLGSNSTLVLVDGRRLAGSGLRGEFADVSALPLAAVDRIEVLLDGASALYGSDAVGGVVNVRLRRDFDGAETRIRTGLTTEGGDAQTVVGQTFGKAWDTGRLILSYEFAHQDRLAASDRAETVDADLRPFGGTDHRVFFSTPGNILGLNATGTAYVPTYAIVPGAAGPSFTAGAANLENTRAGADTLPSQDRHNLFASLAQDVTPRIHLSADLLYGQRQFDFALPESTTIFQVTKANPFFASPTGGASDLIGYAFGDELGPIRNRGRTWNLGATTGATFDLAGSWKLDAYVSFDQESERLTSTGLVDSAFLNEALGVIPDSPATAYSAPRDGYFNPFGGGAANSRAVLNFIGSGYNASQTRSRIETFDVKADGTLFELPGGPVKAAVGGQVRQEYFKTSSDTLSSGVSPVFSGGTTFSRLIGAGFAELNVPIVGPANAVPGIARFDLSLAGRVEHYEDFGLTGNPKLGAVWAPVDELRIRGSYGTSFRAPALPELFAIQAIGPAILTRGTARVLSVIEYGGDPDLKPEKARTWTAGAEWRPHVAPGLVLTATWFDINYRDRISQPVLENISTALSDPAYAPFIQTVDPLHNAADLALVQSLLARSTSASATLFPATSYGGVVNARFVNAARIAVDGLDASAAYVLRLGADRVDLAFDASLLAHYDRALTPTSPVTDLAGVTGQPASLKTRGSATWSRDPYGATLTVSRVGGSTAPVTGQHVGAYTTVDGQLAWRAPQITGPLHGASLALDVKNLLDTSPPFYDSPQGVAYDPANADVLGRVLSLQLIKRW